MLFIKSVNRSEHSNSMKHDKQTMSANQVLVYHEIWYQDEVEIEAAAIFSHSYLMSMRVLFTTL